MAESHTRTSQAPAWHAQSVHEIAAQFATNLESGLTDEQVLAAREKHGLNEFTSQDRISPWHILLGQFKNILIIILLLAAIASFFLGHGVEAVAIGIIVGFSIILGFVQEYRAERAIDALRQMAAPKANVLRGSQPIVLPARELVPGDVILLSAGDKAPADGRLVQSINLRSEEAVLTGESTPSEKQSDIVLPVETDIGDRINMVFAGTTVSYGRGSAIVIGTGDSTEIGKLAKIIETVDTAPTPLQVSLERLGRVLALVGFIIVGLIVVLGLVRRDPNVELVHTFVELLIFGIALAIAVVPEALPAVVTISLAIGVQRMIRRHTLIRRLPAVETLGTTSVICSDKTGTLTKDEMTARGVAVGGDHLDVSGAGYAPTGEFSKDDTPIDPAARQDLKDLLRTGVLCSDVAVRKKDEHWEVLGDSTEAAVIVLARKAGINDEELKRSAPRIDEIPFSSDTKRMTTLCQLDGTTVACSKGAPEVILQSSSSVLTPEGERPLTDADRAHILQLSNQMADQALRVLGVARKKNASKGNAETEQTFLGLIGMIDPPRPEAKDAIRTCESAGIRVVMITGDHPATARAIARELGILKTGKVVTGVELERMSDAELEKGVLDIEVYARVSPAHKLRVVHALQSHGLIVAMTGDGANDAPALKRANIGIAMGISGTDVTKEASDMMLTDDNFASIVAAVEEGRAIFRNVKKYLMYLLSSNIGEVLLIGLASAFGLPLPLGAVQILYVNLATDGLPALALAVDPLDENIMTRPPRGAGQSIFTPSVIALMVLGGAWSGFVNLSLFIWALRNDYTHEHAMTMVFACLVFIEFFKAYIFRSDRDPLTKKPFANKWLNLAVAWELILLMLVLYLPPLENLFGTEPLTASDWMIIVPTAMSVIPVLEAAKWYFRRKDAAQREAV